MTSNCLNAPSNVLYECKPIRCFEKLNTWTLSKNEVELFSTIPSITASVTADGPKVLLCHDMKGGYLEDRYYTVMVQGLLSFCVSFLTGSDQFDSYTFFHWSLIDIFVYFSHHLVTIPPITWITAAHRNGVPVLGTFITEGSEGHSVCRKLLSSEKMISETVNQLVNISVQCRFEGWLINIENKIEETNLSGLLKFVTLLTKSMHERIPKSKVIWYDSIVHPSGALSWQNELNSKNSCFFDACDGIYLNYCWNEDNLRNSAVISKLSNRKYDVFVGIDVFGRGCLGGGGMNTHLAVAEVNKFDLSIALFAPGWVHEILGPKNFHENQLKFWSKLNLNIRRYLSCLPFESSFCRGFGNFLFKKGVVSNSQPWSNLLLQDIQILPDVPFHLVDGFDGGGCLCIPKNCCLINCHIPVPCCGCLIILVYKPVEKLKDISVVVAGRTGSVEHLLPIRTEHKMKLLSVVEFFQFLWNQNKSVDELNGWHVDAFSLNKQMNIINTVSVTSNSGLLIGNIKILEMPAKNLEDGS